ncbi:hypothetical protein B0H67DRAFT_551770 [Lasiosphaeris hirsuta]|uniref:Uncharacterized protein n=1 Tax=Lasiosphaeris hirsuta TaxID=260670 RepID=A0AA40AP22_9PEZI|nr:hypothetical protein B0H67DRAFT_551770 [Lasiosphaeris hirsuta]
MGCFKIPSLVFWRKKRRTFDEKKNDDFSPRPLHDSLISTNTAFSDVEKPLLATGRSTNNRTAPVPSRIASIRPKANPTHSAYSGPAVRDEDNDDSDDADTLGCRDVKPKDSDTWTGSHTSTQVPDSPDSPSSPEISEKLIEVSVGENQEEEKARLQKEAALKKKRDREAQELLDDLQFM